MAEKITKEEIQILISERKMNIIDVIDVIVELNGLCGVGLITLGNALRQHCYELAESYDYS